MSMTPLKILISLACLLMPLSASAQFPGQGNSADWADALPYYNLANKYVDKERYDEAVEKYQEAINRYPYDPDFYINLGYAYRKLDDFSLAEQAFRQALQLNPKDWLTWSNLGNALLKQNKLKETLAAFDKALTCKPPAKDKALLLRDIEDIKKVLAMRQQQARPPQPALPVKATTKPKASQSGWDYALP